MKTGLELRHLRVFAAVVDTGTHTRAARALGLSQSTVSETLSALDRTVGVPLFRKPARGLALTPAGEILLTYTHRMLALNSELAAALSEASHAVQATLVVSAVESIGAYVLPSRLAVLRERWPAVRVEVLTGPCAEIRERVTSGRSDLGLVLEPASEPAAGELLAQTRLLILAAPAHPLVGRHVAAADLQDCIFHMCDAGGNYHDTLRHYFNVAGVPVPRMQAMGTIEGVKRGILAGGKVLGLLPEHAVEAELRNGVLTEVQVRPTLPSVALRAVFAPGVGRSAPICELLEGLRGMAVTGCAT